jgi:hypothetical protein
MVDLVYGVSTFERRRGDFPSLPVVNMFAESIPTEPGVALQGRPGIEDTGITLGDGPVRGVYTADGVLNNSLFALSGDTVYDDGVAIGSLTVSGPVSFAGYEDFVFVNAGKEIGAWDGAAYSYVAFPDDADVIKIVVGASRLIAIRRDTGKFYWSDPLGVTIDALDFATAENSPDTLQDVLYIGDKAILFGRETVEFWPATTDSDLPFAPLQGATFPVGIKGTGMAAHFNRSFAWITNYNEVCVGTPENIISEPELQVRIEASTEASLFVFYVDDTEYLAVRLDGETWAFGARSQVWTKLETYLEDNWVPSSYDGGYFGSSIDGKLLRWSDGYDDEGAGITKVFRAWAPLTGQTLNVSNIIMRTNPGTTEYLVGDLSEPTVELRTSMDGGKTWQPWKSRSLGRQGEYRTKVFWSSLGLFGYPGLLVEVRITDPIGFRMSGLAMNEPFGGV